MRPRPLPPFLGVLEGKPIADLPGVDRLKAALFKEALDLRWLDLSHPDVRPKAAEDRDLPPPAIVGQEVPAARVHEPELSAGPQSAPQPGEGVHRSLEALQPERTEDNVEARGREGELLCVHRDQLHVQVAKLMPRPGKHGGGEVDADEARLSLPTRDGRKNNASPSRNVQDRRTRRDLNTLDEPFREIAEMIRTDAAVAMCGTIEDPDAPIDHAPSLGPVRVIPER